MALLDKLLLRGSDHSRLFHNRAFVLLWSGQTGSVFGDAFFNLAVMWLVWAETQSTLQTAIIQAIWHLPDVLFAPLAGVLADRWDRKSIMVTTSVAAAAVVGAVTGYEPHLAIAPQKLCKSLGCERETAARKVAHSAGISHAGSQAWDIERVDYISLVTSILGE